MAISPWPRVRFSTIGRGEGGDSRPHSPHLPEEQTRREAVEGHRRQVRIGQGQLLDISLTGCCPPDDIASLGP